MDAICTLASPLWRSVIGGVLLHLCLGSIYLWGNITTAVTSYLQQYDCSITYDNSLMVYATALGCQGITMMIGGIIEQRYGAKRTMLLGGGLVSLGTFLSAFVTSLGELMLTFGAMFGVGIGIAYTAPILNAVRWMPEKKGLVTGLIVAGFGSGSFIFGFVATYLYNPTGIETEANGYFAPGAVTQNVPTMFQTLGIIFGLITLFSSFLIEEHTGDPLVGDRFDQGYQPTKKEDIELLPIGSTSDVDTIPVGGSASSFGPSELIQSPLAWHLSSCFVCTAVGGMFLAGTYKTYGEAVIADQTFLSDVGSIASLFNGLGRVVWGSISDRFGPVQTVIVVTFCQSFLISTYPFVLYNLSEDYYALWTFLILFHLGGNFALYLPITVQQFGKEHAGSNYGIIFFGYSLCNVINITVLAGLGIDFDSACSVLGVITFIGFSNLCLFAYQSKNPIPFVGCIRK